MWPKLSLFSTSTSKYFICFSYFLHQYVCLGMLSQSLCHQDRYGFCLRLLEFSLLFNNLCKASFTLISSIFKSLLLHTIIMLSANRISWIFSDSSVSSISSYLISHKKYLIHDPFNNHVCTFQD